MGIGVPALPQWAWIDYLGLANRVNSNPLVDVARKTDQRLISLNKIPHGLTACV
jgi:hypothetical protein